MHYFKVHKSRCLPVIFLVMMLLLLPSCRFLKQKLGLGEYSLKYAREWAKRDSTRVADSLKRVRVDKKATAKPLPESVKRELSDKKAFERTLTDSLLTIGDNDHRQENTGIGYYIIAGSFTSHDNAKKRAAEFSAQGYTTLIINATKRDGTRVEHVSVKTFTNLEKAKLFLKEFKEKNDPGAWMYTRK